MKLSAPRSERIASLEERLRYRLEAEKDNFFLFLERCIQFFIVFSSNLNPQAELLKRRVVILDAPARPPEFSLQHIKIVLPGQGDHVKRMQSLADDDGIPIVDIQANLAVKG